MGSDSFREPVELPVQSSPAVNSRVSPGRKKPTSRPVSANITTAIPATPKAVSTDCASRMFTASVEAVSKVPAFQVGRGTARTGAPHRRAVRSWPGAADHIEVTAVQSTVYVTVDDKGPRSCLHPAQGPQGFRRARRRRTAGCDPGVGSVHGAR